MRKDTLQDIHEKFANGLIDKKEFEDKRKSILMNDYNEILQLPMRDITALIGKRVVGMFWSVGKNQPFLVFDNGDRIGLAGDFNHDLNRYRWAVSGLAEGE